MGAARRFYRMVQENNGERKEMTVRGLPLTPKSRVLDGGAGGRPSSLHPPYSLCTTGLQSYGREAIDSNLVGTQ